MIIDGSEVSITGPGIARGIALVSINPKSGAVELAESFDTCGYPQRSTDLAGALNNIPNDNIVVMGVIDDAYSNLS